MGLQKMLCCLFVAACVGLISGSLTSCDEVRKVFQLRQIGPVKSLPERPREGSDLQVCQSRNLTCCSKKMEERYQVAARRDVQNLLQTSSASLKFLISRNVAAFQESFESLIKASENHTNLVLQASYRNMAGEASGLVRELFTDVGLFLLGSELNVDDITSRFFDALFPLVYHHLINPSLSRVTPGYAECVRSARRDLSPFGAAPGVLANQIGRSGVGGRVLLQALHLGVEVINTTDHLVFSRECRRALLRMQYCPHCHGLTLSKPCMGYCLNVMRGCLASMAEVDPHWREFVRSLEGLSARMHGTQDLEQVLLGVHAVVHDAVAHAQRNGPHLSAQVYKVCGRPSRQPAQSVSGQQDGASIPLKAFIRETGNSLATRRKEFLNSLRLYRTFYGGLADQLCVNQLASADGLACWNGADFVKRQTPSSVPLGDLSSPPSPGGPVLLLLLRPLGDLSSPPSPGGPVLSSVPWGPVLSSIPLGDLSFRHDSNPRQSQQCLIQIPGRVNSV
ncbi:glypican-5 [Oncorhynchus kisutch]|uniref:glypican-5 n=1 Tax=Oncorhynchus kisutch TaxID=8019 RepID=UPI0012DF5B2E|nr:glypican-5 [Oncorhynchus kisutch]